MTNFASKISGAAMLMLAALPIAALATASHAQTVKVSDISVLTPQGLSAFNDRVNAAANRYCADQMSLSARNACRIGVKAELNEKLAGVRTAQLQRASQNLAVR